MEQEKSCKKCNSSKTLKPIQWLLLVLAFYILISSVYGTVILTKSFLSIFF